MSKWVHLNSLEKNITGNAVNLDELWRAAGHSPGDHNPPATPHPGHTWLTTRLTAGDRYCVLSEIRVVDGIDCGNITRFIWISELIRAIKSDSYKWQANADPMMDQRLWRWSIIESAFALSFVWGIPTLDTPPPSRAMQFPPRSSEVIFRSLSPLTINLLTPPHTMYIYEMFPPLVVMTFLIEQMSGIFNWLLIPCHCERFATDLWSGSDPDRMVTSAWKHQWRGALAERRTASPVMHASQVQTPLILRAIFREISLFSFLNVTRRSH